MRSNPSDELHEHLQASQSWADDRRTLIDRSRRTAWRVAVGASVIALAEAMALVALLPLKTVQPYTLLVDRQTGHVEALRPLERQTVTADAALTRSFLVQYVIAREGFGIDTLQLDYRKVALWSSGEARQQYIATMQANNPASPLVAYPRSSLVDVTIKSISSLSPSSALVRFDTQRVDRGSPAGAPTSWAAVVSFTYSGEPMSAADRLINPLGFKVTRYRRDAETLAVPQAPVTTLPASPAARPSP